MRIALFLTVLVVSAGVIVAKEHNFRSLTVNDNLSDQLVNVIFKDADGYVWFGTETGVDRFDGNQIQSYHIPGSAATPRRVSAIARCGDDLYFGNAQGLYRIAPGATEVQRVLEGKVDGAVSSLRVDGNTLYIGTGRGIFIYDAVSGKVGQMLLSNDVLSPDNEIVDMWLGPNNKLWAATRHKLFVTDGTTGRVEHYDVPVSKDITRLAGSDSTIYIGTAGNGVIPFRMSTGTFDKNYEVRDYIITGLVYDPRRQLLYISTDGEGVLFVDATDGSTVRHLTTATSPLHLRSNSVYSMLVDDDDLLWVGYYQMGADYTPKVNDVFEVYAYPGLINTVDYPVRAVAVDGSEKLIGTRNGFFYVDEANGRMASFGKPEMRSNIIFCIKKIGSLYYIGTYNGGMYVFDPATQSISTFTNHQPGFDTGSVFSIETDGDGTMWVGASDGLHSFRNGRETAHYTSDNSKLPQGNVYEIFFDSTGRGWICTENGMAIWNGNTLVTDRFPKGFINGLKIRDVYEDSEHTLYFVPDRGDVVMCDLNLGNVRTLLPDVAENNRVVTFVIEDRDGMIWLGTDKGAIRSDKKNRYHIYDMSDGLAHLTFTLCPPVTDEDGNLWMGNTLGLVKLDTGKLADEVTENAIVLTDIRSNGSSIVNRLERKGDEYFLTLRPNETDIAVSYDNFAYTAPEHNLLEYGLGRDSAAWSSINGGKPVHLYDLAAGTHVLKIRRPGHEGRETVLHITKEGDRFLQSVVALIIIVVIFAALSVYLVFRRHRAKAPVTNDGSAGDEGDAPVAEKPRYRTSNISPEECKRLLGLIDGIMRKQRPYINPELKSADLAEMAGTTSHSLSYLFNQHMKISYYDFINDYRVREFKRLVAEEDVSKYTLTAMARMCGFSSRSSFFRHFKNITGMTPAEYIKHST